MSLTFLQITDHHLGAGPHVVNRGYATAWALDRLLEAIAADAPEATALLCTGDLVDVGTPSAYAFALATFGAAARGAPPGPLPLTRPGLERYALYALPGNHDPRETFVRELFPGGTPAPRLDLAWGVGDVAFVYLDLGTDGRRGVLTGASLALLERVLERGRRSVVVLHHHPIPVGVPWLDRAVPEGIEQLWRALRGGDVAAVLFGHAHTSVESVVEGVPVLGLRSTCFQFAATEEPSFVIQPLHYRVITVPDAGPAHHRLVEVPLTGPARGRLVG
jgi:3',5'-cyclic-AMP phosphodiesterase